MERAVLLSCVAAIAAALALASGDALAQGKAPSGTYVVKVRVVGDQYVVIDQHPVVILEADKVGRIVWELPATSPWRFENDGIAIDGGQFLGCRMEAKGLRFTCTDKPPPRAKQLYPYRLTVYNAGKPIFTDSAVQND